MFGTPLHFGFRIELAEDVLDFRRMRCPEIWTVWISWRTQVEAEAIDRMRARRGFRFPPYPGGPGDEAVAGEIFHGAHCFGVDGGRVELQEFICLRAEFFLRCGFHAFNRRLLRTE